MFKQGRRRSGRFFAIHWLKTAEPVGHLGLVVAKRLAGNGVQRNRVKRIARESFRRLGLQRTSIDVVVRLRSAIAAPEWPAAAEELHRILGELR